MMRRFGLFAAAGVIGLSTITMSCSNSVSKADFKKQLDETGGLGGAVDTQCLVDKLEQSGFQFRKYGDLSADDTAKVTDATKACVSASLSVPSVPTTTP